ncbi:M4 family metallopeptidase [Mesoterricola silvestris]|uniref:M4 family peptidase n=1 Tax=Mesoterricola silvestris TaxID=2927979 RepID=A0AA48K9P5_9BACT|nr:M4 family metallopeptidase [Mesoterricola silvestris]BDU73716.1 hypothetical protein METEAL_28900 [Mesoterricola silvestris]
MIFNVLQRRPGHSAARGALVLGLALGAVPAGATDRLQQGPAAQGPRHGQGHRHPKAGPLAGPGATGKGGFRAGLAAPRPDPALGLPDLGPGHRWIPVLEETDERGLTRTSWQHLYLGLRVWDSFTVTLREGTRNLPAIPSLALARGSGGVLYAPPMPTDLDGCRPLHAILGLLRQRLGAAAPAGKGELILLPEFEILHMAPPGKEADLNAVDRPSHVAGYRLAYRIRGGSRNPEAWDVIADAHTGALLQRIPRAHPSRPAPGTGHTLYSGTVPLITTTREDGGFEMADPVRGWNRVVLSGGPPAALTNASNVWGDSLLESADTPPGSPTKLTTAADAAYGLQVAWDYFHTVHHLRGIDGTGHGITVELDGAKYTDNAAWEPEARTVVVGRSLRLWPFVDLFTLGHEVTHGVTGTRPVFRYGNTEAGALNEATSDFFAQMMVAWARSGGGMRSLQERTIGDEGTPLVYAHEKRDVSGGFGRELVRDLCKPSLSGDGYDEWGPDFLGKDPHFTSGPMIRALQFLRQGASADPASPLHSRRLPEGMEGLGNDRTAALWFSAFHEVGPTGGYLDARRAMLRSAIRLFGTGSVPHLAVRKAFGAINVGDPRAAGDGFDFNGSFTGTRAEVRGPSLVLTAGIPDHEGVTAVQFKVDGLPVGRAHAAPYTLTLDASRLFRNGPHSFQAIASNAWGQTLDSPVVPFTLDNAVEQVLGDPALEATHPLAGKWQESPPPLEGPGVIRDLAGQTYTAHSGTRCAVFGDQSGMLTQRVTLPAGSGFATLELWCMAPQGPSYSRDALNLEVHDLSPGGAHGGTPRVFTVASGERWSPEWTRLDFDLGAYRGHEVELVLRPHIGWESRTRFMVDDLVLRVGPGGEPESKLPTAPPGKPVPGEAP